MPARDIQKADLSALRIDRQSNKSNPGSGKVRKILWVSGVFIVAIILILLGISSKFDSAIEVAVGRVVEYDPSQGVTILTANGYVVAQTQAAIASKGTGRIEVLDVEEGDAVLKGQIIAQLEHDDVDAALEQAVANLAMTEARFEEAEASLTEARLDHERQAELFRRELISKAEFDLSEARYKRAQAATASAQAAIEVARAAVNEAEVRVENTRIRAPFDGTVLTKNADIGEIVAPLAGSVNSRSAVVTIADMSSLEVEADVSESNIQRVEPGQACEIILDAFPDIHYQGYVHKIVPTADRAKATVLTKVRFKNRDEKVLPEMSAKINFLSKVSDNEPDDSRSIVACPQSAIVERQGRNVLFVVRNGQAVETPVELGQRFGGIVEIVSGPAIDTIVILNPPREVSTGTKIAILGQSNRD